MPGMTGNKLSISWHMPRRDGQLAGTGNRINGRRIGDFVAQRDSEIRAHFHANNRRLGASAGGITKPIVILANS